MLALSSPLWMAAAYATARLETKPPSNNPPPSVMSVREVPSSPLPDLPYCYWNAACKRLVKHVRNRPMRVLIADDHEVIRGGVRLILSHDLDIELFEAANGQEAITKTLELAPDLVILDLSMPVMGGYAVAQELRRLAPKIPILFFSIHKGTQLVKDVKAVGAKGFLHKSEASATLLQAVYVLVLHKGTFFSDSDETRPS